VQDVFILPPGASFVNITDSTYFALPRVRLVRLVRDAQLSDSLTQVLARQEAHYITQLMQCESTQRFWQGTTIMSVGILILTLILK
jgi:hypothetical protein